MAAPDLKSFHDLMSKHIDNGCGQLLLLNFYYYYYYYYYY